MFKGKDDILSQNEQTEEGGDGNNDGGKGTGGGGKTLHLVSVRRCDTCAGLPPNLVHHASRSHRVARWVCKKSCGSTAFDHVQVDLGASTGGSGGPGSQNGWTLICDFWLLSSSSASFRWSLTLQQEDGRSFPRSSG